MLYLIQLSCYNLGGAGLGYAIAHLVIGYVFLILYLYFSTAFLMVGLKAPIHDEEQP